jgi:hypothetical protein
MQLKTVEIEGKTYAEVQDGKPVYDDGGKDIPFDAPGAIAALERVNKEAKGHRISRQEAEDRLKAFEGIEDPDAARKALEAISGMDAGKLMDAEKAAAERQRAVDAATRSYAEKLQAAEKEAAAWRDRMHEAEIGRRFADSRFIQEKLALPASFARESFGRHFSLEDGKVVAKDANGNTIYSKANPGELASFDEALEQLVDARPERDQILKGRGQSGSGAQPSGAGSDGGTMRQDEFLSLSPKERAEKMASGKLKLVD